MRKVIPVGFLAMALTIAVPGAPASAAPGVGCGDVITSSVGLTADLVCAGTALTVQGDGVYVDLAGHRISAAVPGEGVGIAAYGDTVVKNGVIEGFDVGLEAGRGEFGNASEVVDVQLSQVRLRDNETAVQHQQARVTLRSSYLTDNDIAVDLVPNDGNLRLFHTDVVRNRVGLNTWSDYFTSTTIVGGYFGDNDTAIRCDRTRYDISGAKFEDNGTAFEGSECEAVTVTRSALTRNGTGFHLGGGSVSTPPRLEKNRFRNNGVAVRLTYEGGPAALVDNVFYNNDRDVIDERS